MVPFGTVAHLLSCVHWQAEVAEAEHAIALLQGGMPIITPVNAFGSSGQHVAVVVEKLGLTPVQYPRPLSLAPRHSQK